MVMVLAKVLCQKLFREIRFCLSRVFDRRHPRCPASSEYLDVGNVLFVDLAAILSFRPMSVYDV
jgi:hypothetical protein